MQPRRIGHRPPGVQIELPVKVTLFRPPVVDVRGAFSTLTDASENEVLALVEFGYVWAFNVADRGAERMEIRILEASLKALRNGTPWRELLGSKNPARRQPVKWDDALKTLLAAVPAHRPWLTGKECRRALLCGRQHFLDLIQDGQLRSTTYRRGPGGSPNVDRQEFERFVASRVIGGI